ncbi:hypothetical protein QBC47DRAFT_407608 [Echria macrotheca]|uniref:Uncharacterized protein n=1 Tax=Echria macrotheca TaxID=438768 RepID=A0AAJ0F423_9PEZI|nr:hypothetical protein QBC47DRAFT_407608 [Echria macrotheca]
MEIVPAMLDTQPDFVIDSLAPAACLDFSKYPSSYNIRAKFLDRLRYAFRQAVKSNTLPSGFCPDGSGPEPTDDAPASPKPPSWMTTPATHRSDGSRTTVHATAPSTPTTAVWPQRSMAPWSTDLRIGRPRHAQSARVSQPYDFEPCTPTRESAANGNCLSLPTAFLSPSPSITTRSASPPGWWADLLAEDGPIRSAGGANTDENPAAPRSMVVDPLRVSPVTHRQADVPDSPGAGAVTTPSGPGSRGLIDQTFTTPPGPQGRMALLRRTEWMQARVDAMEARMSLVIKAVQRDFADVVILSAELAGLREELETGPTSPWQGQGQN